VTTPHFKAFISYSHQNESWAKWLQRSLESYSLPKRLIGSDGKFGKVPPRLSPVFRDREDLSSASDLTSKIRGELEASETLIVICSPAAARSHWVNEEVRHFKSLGRGDRVLALIVDGDPQSTRPEANCFPPALISQEGGGRIEPLAADARKYADGKTGAKLKLIAGILGIRLDELRRRDMQRRRMQRILATGLSAVVVVLLATLTYSGLTSRKAAQLQRSGTEELLGYMLGNLKSLDPIVGLEVVDRNDQQVMDYLQNLGFQHMDDDQLVKTALAWREQGREFHGHGALDQAMVLFQQSRAAFIELYQREGSTTRALFELGQSEFWVGFVHMDKGELDEAEASFSRYGAVTRRLINADPNNAEMVMELAYTLVNLTGLEQRRTSPDADRVLQLAQSALQYNQIALVLDTENTTYRRELVNILAYVADAWRGICDLGKAYEFRRQGVDLARQLAAEAPSDHDRALWLAYALSGMASVQRRMSLTDQALESLTESQTLLAEQSEKDPENLALKWEILLRRQRRNWILGNLGDSQRALQESRALAASFQQISDAGMNSDFQAAVEFAEFKINHAQFAYREGAVSEAKQLLDEALNSLAELVVEKPENRASRYQLARAVLEEWAQTGLQPPARANELLRDYLTKPNSARSCDDASLAAQLAVMRGDKALAKSYTAYLLNKGYYDPEFSQFCKRYEICD